MCVCRGVSGCVCVCVGVCRGVSGFVCVIWMVDVDSGGESKEARKVLQN